MTETGRPPSSNYYCEAKDLPSAQSPRATDDDGYSFPKETASHNDVMTDNAGGNPYTAAGKGVQVKSSDDYNRLGLKGKDNAREIAAGNQTKPTPNEHSHIGSSAQNPRRVVTAKPDSSDDYNHLGLKGRLHAHEIAQTKQRQNEYSRTGSDAQNPCLSGKPDTCGKESDGNANSSTSAGRGDEPEKEYDEAGLVDESAQSEYSEVEVVSEYYEVEVVDESEPEVANKVPGTVSDYDRLGVAKGGNDAGKTGKATPQAYDHVGIANESDYDVAQRDRRNKTIDSDYNRLGGI